MAIVENKSMYISVRESLKAQDGLIVVGEVNRARYDGRKGMTYFKSIVYVSPEQPKEDIDALNEFSSKLLTDREFPQDIYRRGAEQIGNLATFAELNSFKRLDPRGFETLTVVVFPSQEAVPDELVKK